MKNENAVKYCYSKGYQTLQLFDQFEKNNNNNNSNNNSNNNNRWKIVRNKMGMKWEWKRKNRY